jgi:hypothetical protein
MSIKVSEKHGLNPSIPICFWCGENKEEIVLLGKMKGDIEAPMKIILDYEPCDKCDEIFKKGVMFIEVTEFPITEGQPSIQDQAYPTGRHMVITEEATRIMLEDSSMDAEKIIEYGKTLIDKELFDLLGRIE